MSRELNPHFGDLDTTRPEIISLCMQCGREFTAVVQPHEPYEDVVLRIRAEARNHICGT